MVTFSANTLKSELLLLLDLPETTDDEMDTPMPLLSGDDDTVWVMDINGNTGDDTGDDTGDVLYVCARQLTCTGAPCFKTKNGI